MSSGIRRIRDCELFCGSLDMRAIVGILFEMVIWRSVKLFLCCGSWFPFLRQYRRSPNISLSTKFFRLQVSKGLWILTCIPARVYFIVTSLLTCLTDSVRINSKIGTWISSDLFKVFNFLHHATMWSSERLSVQFNFPNAACKLTSSYLRGRSQFVDLIRAKYICLLMCVRVP